MLTVSSSFLSFSRCAVSITGPVTALAMQRCAKSTPSRYAPFVTTAPSSADPGSTAPIMPALTNRLSPGSATKKACFPALAVSQNNGDGSRSSSALVSRYNPPTRYRISNFIKSPTMLQTFSPVVSNRLRPRRSALCVCGKFSASMSPTPHSRSSQPHQAKISLLRSYRSRFTVGISSPSQISCATSGKGVRRARAAWLVSYVDDPWMRGGTPRTRARTACPERAARRRRG